MRVLSIAILAVALASCDAIDSSDADVRILNASAVDFASVEASFGGGRQDFGPLAAGESSDYATFGQVYDYGFFQVVTDTDTLVIQPIDYVGERPVEEGRYTFRLTVMDGSLQSEFVRD